MESLKIISTGKIGGRIYHDENMCSPGDGIRMTYLKNSPILLSIPTFYLMKKSTQDDK